MLIEQLMVPNEFYDKFTAQENCERIAEYIYQYELKKEKLQEYLIALTPRSGSSWLTELLAQTKLAGNPGEWFNPDNLPGILKEYPCSNIQDYIRCIKANQSTTNGFFGLEASFFQLRLVLQGCDFEELFQKPKLIYLTRKDFISQGISLYKAVETGYFHSVQGEVKKVDLPYDAARIKYWILHILQQESLWEQFFLDRHLSPLRLTYEELSSNPNSVLQRIFQYLGIPCAEADFPQGTSHHKIADETNQLFLEQFLGQMPEFINTCQVNRGKPDILKLK